MGSLPASDQQKHIKPAGCRLPWTSSLLFAFDASLPTMSHPPLSKLSLDALYTLLRPVTLSASDPRSHFINWGLSYECRPLTVFEPENEHQCELILELARREGQSVRAAGVGHSPSDLACTSGFMLRTEKLSKIIEVSKRYSDFIFPRYLSAPCRSHCAMHRNAGNLRSAIAASSGEHGEVRSNIIAPCFPGTHKKMSATVALFAVMGALLVI